MAAGAPHGAIGTAPMDEIYEKPGHLIRRAQQIAVAIFMEECAELDLTPVQYAALVAVREHVGIDATRLASLIAFDRSTIGSVIERLEAKGWITRQGSAEDKRVKLLAITAEGRRLIKRAEATVERAQQRILAPLSPTDRTTLVALLSELVRANNDVSRAPQREIEKRPASGRG